MPDFDVLMFLDAHFAENQSLRDALRKRGIEPPSLEVIRKWRSRRSIPAEWLVVILCELEDSLAHPISVIAYMKREHPWIKRRLKAKSEPTGELAGIFD